MKNLIIAISLLAASSAYASDDSACLSFASVASTVAEGRAAGMTEEDFMNLSAKSGTPNTPFHTAFMEKTRRMVAYVFTMELTPAQARKLIYLKCKVGDFK